jgi:hypothetical protein
LHNALGEEVAALNQGMQAQGKHNATFDVHALPAGSYFYTLEAGGKALTKSFIVQH